MHEEKQQKVPIVLRSNAVADPNAMMIKAQHAVIAKPAVFTTGRGCDATCPAFRVLVVKEIVVVKGLTESLRVLGCYHTRITDAADQKKR